MVDEPSFPKLEPRPDSREHRQDLLRVDPMGGSGGHQLRRARADNAEEAVGYQLERRRDAEVTNVVPLAELLQDRPRHVKVFGPRRPRENKQRSAVDRWSAT